MDFLTIGHVCHDWSPEGNILGGTAAYASLLANQLSFRTSIVTSFGKDFEFAKFLNKSNIHLIPSKHTTYFKNIYQGSHRKQILLEKATNLTTSNFPKNIPSPKMVLLGPIANEIDLSILDFFTDALVAICPQGWMRGWNKEGEVFHKILEDWSIFKKADMVILSDEDINHQLELIPHLADLFKILVVTKAENGADVFYKNNKYTVPAFQTKIVDPTGAGDIFATAFLIRFYETQNVKEAAIFANATASICIEKKGIAGIPNRKEILKRINH